MHIMIMLYMKMTAGVFATSASRDMGYGSSGFSVKNSSMSSMNPLCVRISDIMVTIVRIPL